MLFIKGGNPFLSSFLNQTLTDVNIIHMIQHSKRLLCSLLNPFPEFSSVLHQGLQRHFIQSFLCYLQVGKNKLHSIWPLGNPFATCILHFPRHSGFTKILEWYSWCWSKSLWFKNLWRRILRFSVWNFAGNTVAGIVFKNPKAFTGVSW